MNKVCDGIVDCKDSSDEIGCRNDEIQTDCNLDLKKRMIFCGKYSKNSYFTEKIRNVQYLTLIFQSTKKHIHENSTYKSIKKFVLNNSKINQIFFNKIFQI